MKKCGSKVCQFEPFVKMGNERIPTVPIGGSFVYLGKIFTFTMDTSEIKESIISDINSYVDKTDRLPIKPLNKIKILQLYVFSKIRWQFTIYKLSETWVKEKLDNNIIGKFIRKWLQLPVSGNITHLTLPSRHLGINIKTAATLYNNCQISLRKILRCSINPEIRKLAEITKGKNIRYDEIVKDAISHSTNDNNITQWCIKLEKNNERKKVWNQFMGLKEQCKIISFILEHCRAMEIKLWQDTVTRLTTNLFAFCRKALILCLSNASNLKRWGINPDGMCKLCNNLQTQFHVLSNCVNALDRYTWRHNSILYTIYQHISFKLPLDMELYVDLDELRLPSPALLFSNQRPDLVIKQGHNYTVIELTCPNEGRLLLSREYKAERYKLLKDQLLTQCEKFDLILVEVSTLGFMSKNIKSFIDVLRKVNCDTTRCLSKCCEVAIRCSFYIYCRRDKPWTNPDKLNFV